MKKRIKKVSILFMCTIMLLSQAFGFGYSTKVYAATYILADAFVSSASADTVMASTNTKLTAGKQRHIYIKFDLSAINISNVESIILNATKYSSTAVQTLVYNECSDYLRNKTTQAETTTLWTKDNITYNTRPLDLPDATQYSLSVGTSASKLSIDLMELFTSAISKGKSTVTVHFTTIDVDSGTVAVDLYSTRSTSNIPTLTVTEKNAEVPLKPAGNSIGDYLENASIATKTFKIKNFNGDANSFVKVQGDGSLKANVDINSASTFALYTYQYNGVTTDTTYGSTISNYAIKCLDNNKFLSIQNYFSDTDAAKPYYNMVDANTFTIKAVADEVNWSERFYLDQYVTGGYYNMYSHLDTLRDDPAFSKTIVRVDGNSMTSCKTNIDNFKFQFIDVANQDQLEVVQKVSGTSATLTWKAVNGDTTTGNYSVSENATITQSNGYFKAQIDELSQGKKSINVTYSNGSISKSDTVEARIFNHPGLLHNQEELDAMKDHVKNKEEPWYSDYMKLNNTVPNNISSSAFVPTVHAGVGRGTPAGSGNIADFEQSASAAYFNALQWVITGDNKYADTAVNIFNAWADTLKVVDGRDRILGAGMNSYKLANAAEIIRYYNGGYSGYKQSDFIKFQDMMRNVIYPVVQDLASPMVANGNWDTNAMVSIIAIGVLCDDSVIFDRAVSLYQDIHVNGSIAVYVSDSGQAVESARDQGHAQLGIGYMAEVCEVANKQGIDLYGLYDNRLAKAFEWAAKYNLYQDDVSFTPLSNVFGNTSKSYWTQLNSEKLNRGELRPVYELPLSHYKNISGVDVTWMSKATEAMRPQGYIHNDHLNFGTLTTYNGEETAVNEPYFQIRTRLEPWYERNLTKDSSGNYIEETLTSYFTPKADGMLTASTQRKEAPFYQLKNNGDGTYSIRCATTDTYLSVKDEKVGDYNVIKADAKTIGDNEKFTLYSNGASFYFLRSPSHDNRIVYVTMIDANNTTITSYSSNTKTSTSGTLTTKSNNTVDYSTADGTYSAVDASEITLTMYLSTDTSENLDTLTNNEKLILVYNTEEEALKNVPLSITKVKLIDDINVKKGTDKDKIGLSETVDITLSNGTTTSAAVTWDNGSSDYNGDVVGTYKFTGTLKLPDGVTNPESYKAIVDVIVGDHDPEIPNPSTPQIELPAKVRIEGKERVGNNLEAQLLMADGTEFTTSSGVTFKWYRLSSKDDNEGDLVGEDKTYRLVGSDKGKYIKLIAAYYGDTFEDITGKIEKKSTSGSSSSSSSNNSSSSENNNSQENTGSPNNEINPIVNGWENTTNNRRYIKNGQPATGWSQIDGNWYLMDQTGNVQIGWKEVNGEWYLLKKDGIMATGWHQVNNKWYFLKASGAMAKGWTQLNGIWYLLKENGDMAVGWQQSNGEWYYLFNSGTMASNTVIDGYTLNESGALVK